MSNVELLTVFVISKVKFLLSILNILLLIYFDPLTELLFFARVFMFLNTTFVIETAVLNLIRIYFYLGRVVNQIFNKCTFYVLLSIFYYYSQTNNFKNLCLNL